MSPNKLSEIDAVEIWFKDPCYDLSDLAASEEEKTYLNAIQKIVAKTGAPNIYLADYIFHLEERIRLIESYIFSKP